MRKPSQLVMIVISLLFNPASSFAGTEITDELLRQRAHELSSSTLVGGAGWQVYERILHPDYSRWAMGEIYEGREKFVRSLEAWWNYGMRVASREIEMVGFDLAGDIALVRYITTETFVGPDGPAEGFSGYVSNVWVRQSGDWKLLSAEISSINRQHQAAD